MVWIITSLLLIFCFLGIWLALMPELNRQKKVRANDEMVASKWTSIELGPDSLYPLGKDAEKAKKRE